MAETTDPDPSPDMSDCDDALHELYGFLDGELTDERRHLIKHHLEECSPCLEAFDFEVELRNVVATKCREQVPESLKRRIAEALGCPESLADAGEAGTA